MSNIRVLIVDDSALVRQIFKDALSKDPQLEVVGVAGDAYQARDLIVKTRPDVMTLDVEMPGMDGVEFLRRLMPQYPLPVVMVSSLTARGAEITLSALEAGAIDFITKPRANMQSGLAALINELRTKIKMAARVAVPAPRPKYSKMPEAPVRVPKALAESTDKVIAVGASTGGVTAITTILTSLPANTPGMVIVQHMPPGFTRSLAKSLNEKCAMEVREAKTGDRIMPGLALIAPGDAHLRVTRRGGIYEVVCKPGPNVSGHCPSVNVLFDSVAEQVGANAVGVILTGMGKDGAEGLLRMRHAGARTIGQGERSCVVYGMPGVAFELGGVEIEVELNEISQK